MPRKETEDRRRALLYTERMEREKISAYQELAQDAERAGAIREANLAAVANGIL